MNDTALRWTGNLLYDRRMGEEGRRPPVEEYGDRMNSQLALTEGLDLESEDFESGYDTGNERHLVGLE